MNNCGKTYQVDYGSDEPCTPISTECVVQTTPLTYLNLPDNSTQKEINEALLLALQAANNKIGQTSTGTGGGERNLTLVDIAMSYTVKDTDDNIIIKPRIDQSTISGMLLVLPDPTQNKNRVLKFTIQDATYYFYNFNIPVINSAGQFIPAGPVCFEELEIQSDGNIWYVLTENNFLHCAS